MDSREIEQLVEKYWNCETLLEEEKQLRDFFRGNMPENLKETAELFRYFEQQQNVAIGQSSFDAEVKKKIAASVPKAKSVSLFNMARIAAGVVVLVAAGYFVREEVRKAYPDEPKDTFSDPRMALEETKKALMMISNSFNKAHKEASKIEMFNEAEQQIQGKRIDEKKTNI